LSNAPPANGRFFYADGIMGETIVAVKSIILKENQILLLQRSFDANFDAGKWEIAGGRLEFGEKIFK
jgi:8-oxo-dGTP pyrophosphatase MutT (NUDIX family)